MKQLKALFGVLWYTDIVTYINSGNVIFSTTKNTSEGLRNTIETALEKEFWFPITTLVITAKDIIDIAKKLPTERQNNTEQKSDIAFLFPEIDRRDIIDELPIRKEFIDMYYTSGAIYWNINRENYNKSHINKIISHKHYKSMTVRNINTVRILANMVK